MQIKIMEKDTKMGLRLADRDAKGRLLPGSKLNLKPTGRLHSLAPYIREATDGGKEIIERILSISRGEPQYVPSRVRMPDGSYVETQGQPMARLVKGEEADRATYYLADHVFGKAPERLNLTQEGETPLFEAGRYPLHVLEALAGVMAALKAKAEPAVDAEVVSEAPKALETKLILTTEQENK